MASAHFVSRANKNIYTIGKQVKYFGKGEKNKGQQLSRIDVTLPANKNDTVLIKKGESYYWWQFKGGGKNYSREAPKRSQLTRSGYLSTLYDIQDRIENLADECTDASDLESAVDDIKSELESLKDECETNLENMPENLKENSSSGQLLQERIDALDNAMGEFDSLDLDYNEPDDDELRAEAIEDLQLDEDDEESLQDRETEINGAMERIKADKFQEWLDEKVQEISDISLEG